MAKSKEEVVYTRRATDKPATRKRMRQMYERPVSFTNLLPWMEYLPEEQAFLLEDGISVAAVLELRSVGAEARSPAFLEELRDNLQVVLTEALSEEDDAPWIIQIYLQDIPSFREFIKEMVDYAVPAARDTTFAKHYFKDFKEHLEQISREGGLFVDEAVTGGPWQGKVRKIHCVIYRRLNSLALKKIEQLEQTPADSLNDAVSKFVTALLAGGVKAKRLTGEAFYEWMVRWFNPAPPMTEGNVDRLLDIAPYPGDENLPYGSDFAESLVFGMPYSDNGTGTWWFDEIPHKAITIQNLRRIPEVGHLSAERLIGDRIFALFDKMPENTIFVMTLVIRPQDSVRNQISMIKQGSVGDSAEAIMTKNDSDIAQMHIAKGNKLFPLNMVFYIRAKDLEELKKQNNYTSSLLIANGLQPILEISDLLSVDSYIRNLPMCYDYSLDKYARRSRLVFSKHIANLLPLYGRSTGTGHHGMIFFNRGAEPLSFDPLNKYDRKKNAHALILGPTGAGKSAMMCYLMMQMVAMYRPRLFVIEAGNSFGLLGDYFASQELTVNQVSLQPSSDISLPPFADAIKLLDKKVALSETPESIDELEEAFLSEEEISADGEVSPKEVPIAEEEEEESVAAESEDENRDLLGEMEIAARIMITGGETKEDEKMSRADRMMIRTGIYIAAQMCREAGRDQVLTEDVVKALKTIGNNPELPQRKRERAHEMADGMELFCSGIAGQFFNSPGRAWPEVDITIMDIGILAREGYADQLTVAYIGMMNNINNIIERYQHQERHTIVLTDEGHIITTNPLLAPYVVKITKMWRKLGSWFWIATQNLEDFPNASKKMLNMMEWWICLVMPKEEIEQIARFKDLNDEQKSMMLSARKEPGKFVEGVVLADQIQALFRSVPPAIALALAMTEKHEKAERGQLMREKGIAEVDAARIVAERVKENRAR